MRPQASADRWRVLGAVALALLVAYLVLVHWWFTAPMLDMGQQIEDLRDQEQMLKVQIAQRPQLDKISSGSRIINRFMFQHGQDTCP